jgi:hypothetical protein
MAMSDWFSGIALAISAAALGLEFRRWFETGPKLKLSVMADAVSFPNDDGKPKLALTVINRGSEPTMLTHMIAFVYPSRWRRFRRRPEQAGVVNNPTIPAELKANAYWIGTMIYNDDLKASREKGHLYVGVISSHSDRNYLVRVSPTRTSKVPRKAIGSV